MSVDDVKATIRAGNEAVESGGDTFKAAASGAASAEQLGRHTLEGSQADEVREALTALAEAATEVDRTLRRYRAALDHANAYLAKL